MVSKNLLESASKQYNFEINTLEYIPRSSGKIMNQIYSFIKNGKKYIIKFEPPSVEYKNQLRETKAAMDFNNYLSENNLNVSHPLKTINGELVISTRENGEDYIITAFERLNGQTWGYFGSNDKMSFNWGKTMGDMHLAAKDYIPSNEYDVQKDIFDGYYWGAFFDDLKIYPSVYKIAQELLGEIASLPRDKDSFGVIHGDLHQGNFFTNGDKINIIDFGDSIYGWFALDAAISLCHALWWDRKDDAGNDYTKSIIENFMKGYLSANQLSGFWISKIPVFMKYRHLCMQPEKNGIGCNCEGWIYNIENDILFDGYDLNSIADIIKNISPEKKIETKIETKSITARITAAHKDRYEIVCEYGQIYAKLKTSVYYSGNDENFPTTGDFVLINYIPNSDSIIVKTLERKSLFSRLEPGPIPRKQAIAANFDYVFIMASLNHDFNIRRIERYLALARQSGGLPVIVLTKADLVDDFSKQLKETESIAAEAAVYAVSAVTGFGMESLGEYLKPGKTIVFMGSSGVGKSSLVNALAGEDIMAVNVMRDVDMSKGRHTTTHRQLIMLKSGVMIIDTPGMRELGMVDESDGLNETFSDVEQYFGKCKFSDCSHQSEPGCAIKSALKNGELSDKRWESYLRLNAEAKYAAKRLAPKKTRRIKERGGSVYDEE